MRLVGLREAIAGGTNVMPALIDAARARATLGEMSRRVPRGLRRVPGAVAVVDEACPLEGVVVFDLTRFVSGSLHDVCC